MSSHYRLYDGMGEVIPFNARYSYPTQANRAWQSVVKIPAKNGFKFPSSQNPTIRIELPAQAYLNTAESFLTFDLEFKLATDGTPAQVPLSKSVRLQNGAQSWIKRARWVYGSLVGEDIREYNVLVRMLTEHTGTNSNSFPDQTSLSEGVGGITEAAASDGKIYLMNTRLDSIHCANPEVPTGGSVVGVMNKPRRYQVQLALGLFQQNKLLPLKWMASQLAIELELAPFAECCCTTTVGNAGDYYEIQNPTFLASLVEFDGTYDAAILEGLRNGGLPIKFASWDHFRYTPSAGDSETIMIPERNRSIKGGFMVQTPPARVSSDLNGTYYNPWDSHAFLQSSEAFDLKTGQALGHMMSYQWRIGGKYYPSQAVECGDLMSSNGAVEAYTEFAKALNIVGDYRLSTAANTYRWSPQVNGVASSHCIDWNARDNAKANEHKRGPTCFVVAGNFETSNGEEVSGMNGEEQNDIALLLKYTGFQNKGCNYNVFIYYDVLLVLRDNNLVELIK